MPVRVCTGLCVWCMCVYIVGVSIHVACVFLLLRFLRENAKEIYLNELFSLSTFSYETKDILLKSFLLIK